MIGSALRGPIDAMDLDVQRTVPPDSEFLTRYIFAMVPVLIGLADERQRQERHIHAIIGWLGRGREREAARGDRGAEGGPKETEPPKYESPPLKDA